MPKGVKLGPRVTVQFTAASKGGKDKTAKGASYIYMLKSTAEFYGFKSVPSAAVKTKKGKTIAVRGCVGAGSIKVPAGEKNGKTSYKSIPVPNGATIADIQKFLKSATKSKPTSFASVDGKSYPVVTSDKK